MDLWVVRHNYRVPRPYWGFWQFNASNAERYAVRGGQGTLVPWPRA